jgi:hypothetical protein
MGDHAMALRRFVTRAAQSRYASALMWTGYVSVPVHGGLFRGVPLGPLDAFALLSIWWLVLVDRRIGGLRILGTALAVAVSVSVAVPAEHGIRARYYANADASGAFERSTEYRSSTFTRLDDRLDFSRGGRELPLVFFNDIARFNFHNPGQPERDALPFAVVWDGNWWVESDGTPRYLYLDSPRASAQLLVDAVPVVSTTPTNAFGSAVVTPARGWHQIYIRFSSPYAAPRRFSAGELVGDNRLVPLDGVAVRTRRIDQWQMTVTRLFDLAKTAFDLCALGWLAWLVAMAVGEIRRAIVSGDRPSLRRRRLLALFALVAIVEACAFASQWAGRLMLLSGGDDPMTYEFYARNIQMNGLMMRFLDGPYYTQVFYPYFLAAVHAVFGEGMFGVMLVQRLLVAVVVWKVVDIAMLIGGDDVAPAAFGCAAFLAYAKLAPISASLLNESLFVPLLVTWTAAVIRLCQSPTGLRAVGTGLLGGVTALTRSTLLLACAAVFPACWMAWKNTARRGRFVIALAASTGVVVSLIAVRNWIVLHEFVPVPAELPITLLDGNRPPPSVSLDYSRRGPLYDRIGLNPFTREVVEYAITAPGTFAESLGRKFLFPFGVYEPYAPGWGYSVLFLALSTASIVGFALALRARAAPPLIVCLPGLIAITQFAALVVVYPKEERLILPFHMLLVPYAAVAVERALRLRFALPPMPTIAGRMRIGASAARIGGAALVGTLSVYTFVVRTRGISEHFLMLGDQIRDWSIALGPFWRLPLVGPPSNAGGNSFGPIFYWVLWLIRVVVGPLVDNLPHAGGIGLAAAQSCADGMLCAGIKRASGSWTFAIATVLIIASSPFDLALSSVIWNPVLSVAFAKTAAGLVLYWADDLTRPRRIVLCLVAWLAVQAHSGALPFSAAIFVWIFWTQWKREPRRTAIALVEAAVVVLLLQLPSAFARESIQPTRLWPLLLHPEQLRPLDAFRALGEAVASIAAAPFHFRYVPLTLLGCATALLVVVGPVDAIAVVSVLPLAFAVLIWSLWQGEAYEAYTFLTLVPPAVLTVVWTLRLLPDRAARAVAAAALLAIAVFTQTARLENATLVFRLPSYGALVRGSRAVVARGEPVRRIDAPFLPSSSNPEFVYTILHGQIRRDAPVVARLSETGEVTFVR